MTIHYNPEHFPKSTYCGIAGHTDAPHIHGADFEFEAPIEEPPQATDHKKEWFQVTIVLGNFETREEAADIRSRMQTLLPNTFISGAIKGSWH